MCEPPSLWQDEKSRAEPESDFAKQSFLEQLSDQISQMLHEHGEKLHEHLRTLLAAQEQRARTAETAIEAMVMKAIQRAPGPPDFELPGAVLQPEVKEPPDIEPPSRSDLRVVLPYNKAKLRSAFEVEGLAGSVTGECTILEAIPSMIQSSLALQEAWHHDCLQNWTLRQEGRHQQASARLEQLLQQTNMAGRQRPALLTAGSVDTISTPPVEVSPPTPTPKGDEPVMLRPSEAWEVAPPPSEQAWVWYPAVSPPSWRRCCFLLLEDSSQYAIGRIIAGFMLATIIVSSVSFVIETLPSLKQRPVRCQELLDAGEALTVEACEPVPLQIFHTLETICIVIFTMEYCLRLALCHTDPRYGSSFISRTFHYAVQPLNLVDVIAVLPFYLKLVMDTSQIGVFGTFRLMRVCRLLKLAKHHKGIMICWEALVNSGLTLALLFFYEVLFGIIFATILHTLEGSSYSVSDEFTGPYIDLVTGKQMPAKYPTGVFVRPNLWDTGVEPSPFYSIPAALWWVFTTTTTVGYGDFAPTTTLGQCLGVIVFYFGIILLALPIGVVSQNFEIAYRKQGPGRRRSRRPTTSMVNRPSNQRPTNHVLTNRPVNRHLVPETHGSIRRWIFIVLNDPNSSYLALALSYVSFALIIVTTFSLILESMPAFSYTPAGCGVVELTVELCRPEPDVAFGLIEMTGTIYFTVEYALRLLLAHSASAAELGLEADFKLSAWRKTLRYALQPLNVIDVLAIVPYYLDFIGIGGSGAAVLRVLRLVRIFRVLKSPKMRACVDMILTIVLEALPGIVSVFSLTWLVCIILGACIFFAEGTTYSVDPALIDVEAYPMGAYIRPTKDGREWEPTPFQSILHTVWWFFTTATTVGYGDYVPTTTAGKIVAIFVFYAGIVLVAIKLTIVQVSFRKHYPEFCDWQSSDSGLPTPGS